MSAKTERIVVSVRFLSALCLALSFVLPITEYATYVDADGRPLGFLGQALSGKDSDHVTSYGYFWEEPNWLVPIVFFLPALLIGLMGLDTPRLRLVLTLVAPLVAACLLIPLAAMVSLADFSVFPGTGGERAYGGYVALCALGLFLITTSMLAISRSRRRPRCDSMSKRSPWRVDCSGV